MKEYDDALKTTINAYIRFLPRYYGELMYRGITSAPEPNNTPRSPLGQVGYRDGLVTPEIKVVVRPNNDTIYGNGYFNLKDEPVIIKVPENPEKRFWSIQIADRWTNIIPGIGSRTKNKPGLYALVGPNWKGELPEEIEEDLQIPVLVSMPFLYTKTEKRDEKMKNTLMAVSVSAGFVFFVIGMTLAKEQLHIVLNYVRTFF